MKDLIPLIIVAIFVLGPQLIAGFLRVRQNAMKQRDLEASMAENAGLSLNDDVDNHATEYPHRSPGYAPPFDPFASVAAVQTTMAIPPMVAAGEQPAAKPTRGEASEYVTTDTNAHSEKTRACIDHFRELISTPEGVMSAFIASEVFRRPEEYW
ncbi:MAG: hypothetical protein PHQ75_07670 [Thermoguttaceae bacterium]|nr:hypothetical protein [Thermoguttaceae bacterium]